MDVEFQIDPTPEQIPKWIVDLYRKNLTLQPYMNMYLHGQITWREMLEFSIKLIAEQYEGAMQGWKQSIKKEPTKNMAFELQEFEFSLIDEKPKKKRKNEIIQVCPTCGFSSWLSEEGAQGTGRVCAVCDAKRGSSQYRFFCEQITLCLQELQKQCLDHGFEIPERLGKLIKNKPTNESSNSSDPKRLPYPYSGGY